MNYFFYDGNCPFCSKAAMRLKELCLSNEIKFSSFRDYSENQLLQVHKSLTQEVLTGNVQYICKGIRYPGFFAIRKISSRLKYYRYFFWILYLPLVPIIGILFMNYLKQRTGHESKE